MRGQFFYLAVIMLGLNIICYGNCFWGIFLSLYGFWVIWKFHSRVKYLILIVSVIAALFWAYSQIQTKRPISLMDAKMKTSTLLIHIDQCEQSEETLRGIGYDERGHYYVRFTINKLSQRQQRQLKDASGMFRIQAQYLLSKIAPPTNFFQFDTSKYWYSRGIVCHYQAQILIRMEPFSPKLFSLSWIDAWIKKVHVLAVRWFDKLPSELRAYSETLLLGYVSSDFFDNHEGLQKLGLIHLFSISGFQVQLLMGMVTYLCRKGHLLKEHRLLLSQFILVLFWWFAKDAQSLIRSILAVFLENCFVYKVVRMNRFDLWGLTICLSLLISPGLLCQLGGQLTIVLSFTALWLQNIPWWLVGLKFNLAIIPLLLWNTYEFHPVSLLVNLIFVPLFAYIIVPFVVIGVLASYLGINNIVESINASLMILQKLIEYMAMLPGNIIFGQPPIILITFLMITSFVCIIYHHWYWHICLLILYGLSLVWIQLQHAPEVVFIDIGQGDATYFKLMNGENMLVDVGGQLLFNKSKSEQEAQSRKSVSPIIRYLKAKGVQKIDKLVLTHKDMDHIGNLKMFLKEYQVKQVIVPEGMQYLPQLQLSAINQLIEPVMAKQNLAEGVEVIAPDHRGTGENADSIGLYVTIGRFSFVLTGDLDQAGENRIVQQFNFKPVTFLKLGHHGSRTSSSQCYIDALRPSNTIVSAGKHNRFGHPHAEVLQRLKSSQIKNYQTAQNGMICVRLMPDEYQVKYATIKD